MRRAQGGFTLIELVVATALLATMLALLYSALGFALKSWDAGAANGRRTADLRIGQNFLRREMTELFPMRWKDPLTLKLAFSGEKEKLQFVSARPPGLTLGGLALVGVEVQRNDDGRTRDLVMHRAMPDDEAKSFAPLDRGERTVLMSNVGSVQFSYFGAENDFNEPRWTDDWTFPGRVPQLVRMRVKDAGGAPLPEFVVRVMLGEEAGCLENSFQRFCRPRRP